MRVALLGLGLIGGSIARAIRAQPEAGWSVTAWTPGGLGPRLARDAGVIAAAADAPEAALEGADLVVLAAPPRECEALLRGLAGPWRTALEPGAVVTDVASTKGTIVALASGLGLRFVGGHPMAGSEASGFAASDAGLFRGRPWVVVPPAEDDATAHDADAVARVESLAEACGANPVRMDAADHDRAVAAVSHLPLVVSAALVEAVAGTAGAPRDDWPQARALAATGWEGMTRLARGDPTMGAGIAATNAPAIAARLRDLRAVLDDWIAALEAPGSPDPDALRERLEAARAALRGDG